MALPGRFRPTVRDSREWLPRERGQLEVGPAGPHPPRHDGTCGGGRRWGPRILGRGTGHLAGDA